MELALAGIPADRESLPVSRYLRAKQGLAGQLLSSPGVPFLTFRPVAFAKHLAQNTDAHPAPVDARGALEPVRKDSERNP